MTFTVFSVKNEGEKKSNLRCQVLPVKDVKPIRSTNDCLADF